jgi:integrase
MRKSAMSGAKKTGEPGVYYREHPTRKHGVKFDRQWIIRQTLNNKQHVSVIGWMSEGVLIGDAMNKAAEYKANNRWNKANPDQPPKPICKADEDAAAERKRQELEQQRQIEARKNITILQIWNEVYYPLAEQRKKPATVTSERTLFDKWIRKDYGNKRLTDITKLDFARLSKKITKAGRSPRTVHYVASVLLQIWSVAFDNNMVEVQPPRRRTLNLPDIDNERTRAFTTEEAKSFLEAIKLRSPQWHNICLLSILAGLRASEIFKLKKTDVDLERGLIFLRTPKKSRSQHTQISQDAIDLIAEMLKSSNPDSPFVVSDRKGQQIKEVSRTVDRVIEELELNNNISDKKEKLTFHSFRHTAATWALEYGEDIYRVSKMLRHSTVKMTEQRYAHLSNDTIRRTSESIGKTMRGEGSNVVDLEKAKGDKA